MNTLIERLLDAGFKAEQIRENEPMHRHTTMRVGGPADVLAEPGNEAQIRAAVCIAQELGAPLLVIGGGSNLIVRDGGVRGLVLKLGDRFARISREGNRVHAEAGARLSAVGAFAQREGLAGFEFAAGIPGTVGGGVLMNAGAYGGELKDVLVSGRVLMGGEAAEYARADFAFGYRESSVMRAGGVVLGARFELAPGDPDAIARRMNELARRRREKQPLDLPSAGSTFKRPEGHFAGALIERAGLKGFTVGGAMVSEKHAGFVVNAGGATARDVLNLIEQIQQMVYAHAGVPLTCEVRIAGEG